MNKYYVRIDAWVCELCGHKSERWHNPQMDTLRDEDGIGWKDEPACPKCGEGMGMDTGRIRIMNVPAGAMMVW